MLLASPPNSADPTVMGIGAAVSINEGSFVNQSTVDDGPVEQVGIRHGDIILAVDGGRISDESGLFKIRGPEGSTIMLSVRRSGSPEPFDITVVRSKYDPAQLH